MLVSFWFIFAQIHVHTVTKYTYNKTEIHYRQCSECTTTNMVHILEVFYNNKKNPKHIKKYLVVTSNQMLSAVGDESRVCEHSHREANGGKGRVSGSLVLAGSADSGNTVGI